MTHTRVRAQSSGLRAAKKGSPQRSALRPILAVLVTALLLACARARAADPLPELTAPVNDFAKVVDAASAGEIDRMIRTLQAATGDIVVVATVPTIEPYGNVREYIVKLFENHGKGIGQKGKNNGLLILLALKERRVEVEVGYDLEQWVTDGFAGETSREVMAPFFRKAQFGQGLRAGTERIIGRIAQGRGVTLEGVRAPRQTSRQRGRSIPGWLPIAIFIVILIVSRLGGGGSSSGFWGRRGGWSSGVGPFGGGFGGGFGGFGGGSSGGGGGGSSW